jgi:PRTRC genetic system protein C
MSLILRFRVTFSDTNVINPENLQRRGTFDMALTVTKMTRVFQFNGIRLPDPNPEMSVDNVKALYSAQYPELTTAVVNGPEAVGDKMRYTFDRAIGSKG